VLLPTNDPAYRLDPEASEHLFVCGASPLSSDIYDKGCSDASGSGDQPDRSRSRPLLVALRAGILVQRPRDADASRGRWTSRIAQA